VQLAFAAVEAPTADFADALARLSLEAVAHSSARSSSPRDSASSARTWPRRLLVILDGEAKVVIDGQERSRLTRDDFFGEVSTLTEEGSTAVVIAASLLRAWSSQTTS
jgi:hypothetical protein